MLREPEIFHVLDFYFFCIIFRIVFFLYLVNLVITLLGCHLSVPLSSSRQPVGGGDRLRRLLTTCMMYLTYLQALQDV